MSGRSLMSGCVHGPWLISTSWGFALREGMNLFGVGQKVEVANALDRHMRVSRYMARYVMPAAIE